MFRDIAVAVVVVSAAVFVCSFSSVEAHRHNHDSLEAIKQWKLLDFGFPTEQDRQSAIKQGNLVPANAVPIDVAPHYRQHRQQRVFITIPRFQTGIPYSLATVGRYGQELQPYPNYDWHKSHGKNCDGITSAFRVAITDCNQMWIIDSGMIGSESLCPPQLLLFDLVTDKLIHRHRFDKKLYTQQSLLINPIVNVENPPPYGNCCQTKIYVADVNNHGLVVYDYLTDKAWRVEHQFMYPEPNYFNHTIAGETFQLIDGIFGMETDGENLYFHPLASRSEYAVPLKVLDKQENWRNGVTNANLDSWFSELGQRPSQCAAEAMDSEENLYCVTFNPIKLISWNVRKPYEKRHFCELRVDPRILEFVSGMKVVHNHYGDEEIWMMSNRFQKISAGTQNPNEINYRVVRGILPDMLRAAKCNGSYKKSHNRFH